MLRSTGLTESTFVSQFQEALSKDQKELILNESLSDADREFLQSICVPALPDQTRVDLSDFQDEKIEGYAIVLKYIAGKNFLWYLRNFQIKDSGIRKRDLKVRVWLRNFVSRALAPPCYPVEKEVWEREWCDTWQPGACALPSNVSWHCTLLNEKKPLF